MALITFENLPSTNTPLNAANLNNNFNECNNIVESGSNSNGRYIKFSNGTMICYKTISVSGVSITNSWGSLYESTSAISFGNFPKTFISKPTVLVTKGDGQGSWHEGIGNVTTSSAGSAYVTSAVSRSNVTLEFYITAIGAWK